MPQYDLSKLRTDRWKRLANEHQLLDELCSRSTLISYRPTKKQKNKPPEEYEVTYKVKSYVGINADQMPIEGHEHSVKIIFPSDYPDTAPECIATTTVWHPNVRFHNKPKGRICVNAVKLGLWHSLDMLVLRIGEILQYKNYLADMVAPFPEDQQVAKWVKEVAEPKGLFSRDRPVDHTELLDPEPGIIRPEAPLPKPKSKIKIKKRDSGVTSPTQTLTRSSNTGRPKIRITKK